MFHLLLVIIYLAFISLGLPDSLLGAAWPSMYKEFSVPISYAGGISMIISIGTIISSLQSEGLTKKFGTGKVTTISVLMTAVAMFGFSTSNNFVLLCLWAIPYGLGAGSVDASLNNYVAIHYASRHMSWLHCMWGLGASIGPYIMGYALSGGQGWTVGYLSIAIIQITLTVILILSLPLWKKRRNNICEIDEENAKPLSLYQIIKIPGAKEVMITFFCYCAIEQTTGLWASSYLVLHRGFSAEYAASLGGLFFIGITVGRAISGFLTIKLNDTKMVWLGQLVTAFGIILLFLSFGDILALMGLIFIGLGCAPIYPSIIHATPNNFGTERSRAMIGVQMASAYVGTCIMPPIFGFIANNVSISLFPVYLLVILLMMAIMFVRMLKKISNSMESVNNKSVGCIEPTIEFIEGK